MMHDAWRMVVAALRDRELTKGAENALKAGSLPVRAQSMLIDEVEDIWKDIAEDDDWTAFHAKIEAVRGYGRELRQLPATSSEV